MASQTKIPTNAVMNPSSDADPQERYRRAMDLCQARQYDRAADLLEGLCQHPTLQGHLARFYHAQACRYEAERQVERGRLDLAIRFLQRGVHSAPRSTALISFLAECFLRQGNYARAGVELTRLAELDRDNAGHRFKEAISYYLAGQGDQAIHLLETLAGEFPGNFAIQFNLGMILAAQDQPDRAIPHLTKASRLRPENVDVHWRLGLAQGLRGHTIEAVRHLQQAHRLEPDNHWLLCHLILAVRQAKAQGIDARMDLVALEQATAEDSRLALDELADLIVREPEFVTAFLDLPRTEVDNQIFSTLLQILMRALERHPEYADLHFHCSCVLQRLGQAPQAIAASRNALAINPRYVTALIHLAKLYAQTNEDGEAIERLKTAVKLGANFADVHCLLGNLYRRQGCLDDARHHYRRALKINGEFKAAKDELEALAV